MFTTKKFEKAIKNWQKDKHDFKSIRPYFSQPPTFHFSPSDQEWLAKNNNHDHFRIYIGILDDQLYQILAPLDKNGEVKKLNKYVAVPSTPLQGQLNLTEQVVITKTKTTVLGKNFEVLNQITSVESPYANEPSLTEDESLKELIDWRNNGFNWLYLATTEASGKNIFNYFSVPYSDLKSKDGSSEIITSAFGLKNISAYPSPLPVLIFIAHDDHQGHLYRFNQVSAANFSANAADWASPCPPFCDEDG